MVRSSSNIVVQLATIHIFVVCTFWFPVCGSSSSISFVAAKSKSVSLNLCGFFASNSFWRLFSFCFAHEHNPVTTMNGKISINAISSAHSSDHFVYPDLWWYDTTNAVVLTSGTQWLCRQIKSSELHSDPDWQQYWSSSPHSVYGMVHCPSINKHSQWQNVWMSNNVSVCD